MVRCANCGTGLAGPYCHQCGQEAAPPAESLPAFVVESVRDAVGLRSRTVRSLWHLLVRPGELTAAYFDGRRVRYTKPIQLYLVAAAVFFVANSYQPFITIAPDGAVTSSLSAANAGVGLESKIDEIREAGGSVELFRERFRWTASRSLPHFMLGSILLFALSLALFDPRRSGLRHLVFSLHWTGFFLLLMSFERLLPDGPGSVDWMSLPFVLAAPVHLILSLRRGYGHAWPRAVPTGIVLFLVFNVVLVAWMIAVVAFATRQAG